MLKTFSSVSFGMGLRISELGPRDNLSCWEDSFPSGRYGAGGQDEEETEGDEEREGKR